MTPDTILWIAIIIVAAVIAGIALKRYRARLFSDDAAQASPLSLLSLDDLRRMRDEGEITDEEFDRLRTRLFHEAGASPRRQDDERRAQPGYDLTGEPLPGASTESPDVPSDERNDAESDGPRS